MELSILFVERLAHRGGESPPPATPRRHFVRSCRHVNNQITHSHCWGTLSAAAGHRRLTADLASSQQFDCYDKLIIKCPLVDQFTLMHTDKTATHNTDKVYTAKYKQI